MSGPMSSSLVIYKRHNSHQAGLHLSKSDGRSYEACPAPFHVMYSFSVQHILYCTCYIVLYLNTPRSVTQRADATVSHRQPQWATLESRGTVRESGGDNGRCHDNQTSPKKKKKMGFNEMSVDDEGAGSSGVGSPK